MGSKIEYIVALLIVFIVLVAKYVHINPINNTHTNSNNKTIEFNNFVAYDLNSTTIKDIIKGKQAVKYSDKWILKEPKISTKDIKDISSKYAIYSKNFIVFKGNVTAVKKNGTILKSNYATYNLKKSELFTPKRFYLYKDKDKVTGKELFYDKKHKITKAKDVNGTFKLKNSQ